MTDRSTAARIEYLKRTATSKPHGTRGRYSGGCRCADCKEANREYEAQRVRRRIFHGPALVSAAEARAYILWLQENGLGRHTISKVSGVHDRRIWEIANGERLHVKAETARRILEVTPADRAGGALVTAGPTMARIKELVEYGYTKRQIAKWLGYNNQALQFRRGCVTQLSADRVEALYNKIQAGQVPSDSNAVVVPCPKRRSSRSQGRTGELLDRRGEPVSCSIAGANQTIQTSCPDCRHDGRMATPPPPEYQKSPSESRLGGRLLVLKSQKSPPSATFPRKARAGQ